MNEEFIFWNLNNPIPSNYNNKELGIHNFYTPEKPPFKEEHKDICCIHWTEADKFISFKDEAGNVKSIKKITSFDGFEFEYLIEWIKALGLEEKKKQMVMQVQAKLREYRVENMLAMQELKAEKETQCFYHTVPKKCLEFMGAEISEEQQDRLNLESKNRMLYAMYLKNFNLTADFTAGKISNFKEFTQIYLNEDN